MWKSFKLFCFDEVKEKHPRDNDCMTDVQKLRISTTKYVNLWQVRMSFLIPFLFGCHIDATRWQMSLTFESHSRQYRWIFVRSSYFYINLPAIWRQTVVLFSLIFRTILVHNMFCRCCELLRKIYLYSQESLISNRESFEMAVPNLPTLVQTLKEEDILQPELEPSSNSWHFIEWRLIIND